MRGDYWELPFSALKLKFFELKMFIFGAFWYVYVELELLIYPTTFETFAQPT